MQFMSPSWMLMGASACAVFLAIVQMYERKHQPLGYKPSRLSIAMTWLSAIILPALMIYLKRHGVS